MKNFKVEIQTNPQHRYFFREIIKAKSWRGLEQTNDFKRLKQELDAGRFRAYTIEIVK
tara:strand:- start:154 stop:327 length:174 start_codon:yes stop_codon:yes gene_type:complete